MAAPAMLTPWYAAWMIAFCSAWRHRQVSSANPDAAPDRQRSQPPSPQLGSPRGVSLYPVLRTIRSLTMTAPTWRRRQVDRVAARRARFMKYSSHGGRATRAGAGARATGPGRPDIGRQLAVVGVRLQRRGVAVDPDVPDAGRRHQPKNARLHRQPRAENGDDGDLLAGDRRALGRGQRRRHVDRPDRQPAGGFEGHQHRELLDQFAKLLVPRPPVPEDRELVLDQRVIEDPHLAH